MRNRNTPAPNGNQPSRKHPALKRLLTQLLPGLLGSILYLVNNLDVIHGLIAPPPGYAPVGVQRYEDIGQYLTWLRGLEKGWLLPNYHAPWSTPPGFIVPGLIPVSILQRSLSLNPVLALQLFSLAGYIFTAYALAFAYRTFCKTRRQVLWSLLFAFSCVPVASLPGLFRLSHGHGMLSHSAGAVEFFDSTDGFLHGLAPWVLMTFGTGAQVLAMALLTRYFVSHERRWLTWLAVLCLVSALIHPFEIFVTITVAGIVLLRRPGPVASNLASLCVLFVAAAAGLSPYLIQSHFVPWVHELEVANRHVVSLTPDFVLWMIGLPAILVVILLLFGVPKNHEPAAMILKTWFVATLLVFYVPGIPFAPHMLHGLFFAVGLLLTLQLKELLTRYSSVLKSPLRFFVVPIMAWMLFPHIAFRLRAWKDGNDIQGIAKLYPFSSAIAPVDEFATLDWFRKNATPNDLVLATEDAAPWLATAPIHVFASHSLLSLETARPHDNPLRNSFFDGTLTPLQAKNLLETLGVKFVVVPDGSPGSQYLENAKLRVHFKSWSIYELPGAHMKPYHDERILALGT
jgi:hypothetical protein